MEQKGAMFRKNFSDILNGFKERDCILLIDKEEYVNTKQKLPYICNKHKDKGVQYTRWDNFRLSVGCYYCSYEYRGKNRRLNFEDVEKAFLDRDYILLSNKNNYKGNKTKLAYICPKHNDKGIQQISWADFNSGCGCYYCGREKVEEFKVKYTLEHWEKEYAERGYTLLNPEYKGTNSFSYFVCEKHPDKIQRVKFANFAYQGDGCSFCAEDRRPRGKNHYAWTGNAPEYERIRKSKKYILWKISVLKRDNRTCQCCGSRKGKDLRAHHIKGFANYPELRLEVSNGITLCKYCHDTKYHGSLHNVCGCWNVTEEQLTEYIASRKEELLNAN